MKIRLVPLLACPDCGADLVLAAGALPAGQTEVTEGALDCTGCARRYPITRGVPRLLPRDLESLASEVADGFGWQWNTFDELMPEYEAQFYDWLHLGPEDFKGKRVIEGGCGKGRHTALVARYGATDIFAIDLGSAVEAAHRNVGHLDAVHVIQGDISRPPLKRVGDVAFSNGVIHHMPEPITGVRGLASKLVPGGRITIWVYGYENNEWIVKLVNPVREAITSKMPRKALYELSKPLGWLVAGAAKLVYKPLETVAPAVHDQLFYKDYITYVARLPTREIHNIVFDQLVTPVAYYMSHADVEALFAGPGPGPGDAKFERLTIEPHNANSWRANAYIGPLPTKIEAPAPSKPVAEKAVAEKAVVEKAVAEKAVADKPVADKVVAEKAVADKAVAETPVVETPVLEDPVVAAPVAVEAAPEAAFALQAQAESPVAERPAPKKAAAKKAAVKKAAPKKK